MMATWLADVLRSAGCKVVEVEGWQQRGRGQMSDVAGVLCHHTGGPLHGDAPSLDLVLKGRGEPNPLPGPLSQLLLGRDGTFHVLAAGRCNHAGAGVWQGIVSGNSRFIGIEAENAGTPADPWPKFQMAAYVLGVAAILRHVGRPAIMAAGHREYATPKGRKIDPLFDMDDFRDQLARIMRLSPAAAPFAVVKPAVPVPPTHGMLVAGDHGPSVEELQRALNAKSSDTPLAVDGVFGPGVKEAVIAFQVANGLKGDGAVGPITWKALGIS